MNRLWIVIVIAACAHGRDRDTIANVPAAAAAALQSRAGGAPLRVGQDGELYEGTWREGGLEREAKVDASGKLIELEQELAPAEVPPAVREAAGRALAGATGIKFVRLLSGHYEAEGRIGGKEREVTFTEAGEPVRGHDDDHGEDEDD